MSSERFNVLMVLADQHHADLMGCAGHGQVLTPNLDAFAATGMRFTNTFCQNTICTPSRVSILSGQYCHNHGLYGLTGPAPLGLNNLMRQFRAAGYRTAAIGKLHLPNAPRNWLADDVDLLADSYESADGTIGKSAFLDELEALGLRKLEDSWHNPWNYGPGTISLDAMPSRLPYEHTQDVWSARQAIDFIDAAGEQPFCMQVALQRPHHPLLPNEKFWSLYPSDLDLPATFNQRPDHRPPHFQEAWHGFRQMQWDYAEPGESFEDGARRTWRGTLACISQVDDAFGMILRALDERALTDRTIVIYGSDHGAYHCIHGLPEKAPGICSDAVCRVPMIWRVPQRTTAGSVCNALVENTDMTPTLTAMCGVDPIDSADGLDITPLLTGDADGVRDIAVTENPWSRAIRWGPWRMVHYPQQMFDGTDVGELYHITDDPDETRNLYHESSHESVVAEGRRLLVDWLIRTTRIVTSNPAVHTVDSGDRLLGRCIYPLSSDARAPNPVQPLHRADNHLNYL